MPRRALSLVLALAAGWPPGAVAAQAPPGGCTPPYGPVYFDEARPGTADTIERPTLAATEVPIVPLAPPPAGFDSDGDGADDVVAQDGDAVTITRSDGVVAIEGWGVSPDEVTGVGDIDGDGRDELSMGAAAAEPVDFTTFLVPGTVAPGSHVLDDIGIEVHGWRTQILLTNDGRLVVSHRPDPVVPVAPSDVYEPAAVLAVGPGGDIGDAEPRAEVDDWPLGTVDLGGPVPALVFGGPRFGGEVVTTALDVVQGDEVTVLTTDPRPSYAGEGDLGDVRVLTGPGGTFLTLTQAQADGTGFYVWSVADPCTALVLTGPPVAPPAAPVAADAAFTG